MPASVASSSRRRPGVRRRGPAAGPTSRATPLPTAAQEATEVVAPPRAMSASAEALGGPVRTRIGAAFPGSRRGRIVAGMTQHDHHPPCPSPPAAGRSTRPLPCRLRHPPPRRRQGARALQRLRRDARRRRGARRQLDHGDRGARLDRHRQRRPRRPRPLRRPPRRRARPTMTFQSTAITGAGDGLDADGDLTIGDVTRPMRVRRRVRRSRRFVDGTRHAGFEATGELRRKEFGLDFGPPGVPRRRRQDRPRPRVRRAAALSLPSARVTRRAGRCSPSGRARRRRRRGATPRGSRTSPATGSAGRWRTSWRRPCRASRRR